MFDKIMIGLAIFVVISAFMCFLEGLRMLGASAYGYFRRIFRKRSGNALLDWVKGLEDN